MYPLSKHGPIVTNSQKLQETAPEVAAAFRALRSAADGHSALDETTREFIMLAGFATAGNQDAFRIHVNRAHALGASKKDLEQLVILLLGTSLGLAPTVATLEWVRDELD